MNTRLRRSTWERYRWPGGITNSRHQNSIFLHKHSKKKKTEQADGLLKFPGSLEEVNSYKIGAVNEAQNSFCVVDAGCDATLVCEHMHNVTSRR